MGYRLIRLMTIHTSFVEIEGHNVYDGLVENIILFLVKQIPMSGQ